FECPSCHGKHFIFGDSHVKQTAMEYGIDKTAQIPIDSRLAAACDRGGIADFEADWLAELADSIEPEGGRK
ncbi:MAG TPA: dinitrogenase iron-molybdenum cofactor biosynthesis protein, partial [Lachnospiraceae bacterium]|nr:dinitrogenase iron-molybdenum cofactor biosynthesis protein [Lachnospiraceae bacterium]